MHRAPRGPVFFYAGERMAEPGDDQELSDSWSRYWSAGHLHSCPTSFSGYYGPETQALWRKFFAHLGADDVLLELGCGNGGLLAFAAESFADGAAPQLMGIDAADLDTGKLATTRSSSLNAATARIVGRTRFHVLPLGTASVTALVSQFAFEYGVSESAWREVFRVLAPKARLLMVVHKIGSLLDRVAKDELTLGGEFSREGGLLDLAMDMVPLIARSGTPEGLASLRADPSANRVKEHYNSASQSLLALGAALPSGGYADDLMRETTNVLGRVLDGGVSRAIADLESLRVNLIEHRARLAALRAAALGESGVRDFCKRLEINGFKAVSASVLEERGEEMGWAIEGIRE